MPTVTPPNPLLTVDQVATWFGVHAATVRRLIGDGQIAAIRVGGQVHVDQAEAHRYLDENTVCVTRAQAL